MAQDSVVPGQWWWWCGKIAGRRKVVKANICITEYIFPLLWAAALECLKKHFALNWSLPRHPKRTQVSGTSSVHGWKPFPMMCFWQACIFDTISQQSFKTRGRLWRCALARWCWGACPYWSVCPMRRGGSEGRAKEHLSAGWVREGEAMPPSPRPLTRSSLSSHDFQSFYRWGRLLWQRLWNSDCFQFSGSSWVPIMSNRKGFLWSKTFF